MCVDVTSETGSGNEQAEVRVYNDAGELFTVVTGALVLKQGADGGWYRRIELTRQPA